MYEAKINDGDPIEVDFQADGAHINGEVRDYELAPTGERSFQVIRPDGSDVVHIEDINAAEKTVQLRINGKKATVAISTELDRLLKEMGLEDAIGGRISEGKAPMPGLIHSIKVEVGQEVEKGDVLLILEAMKMENVIKSPDGGTISGIPIEPGQSVEKNQLLISFA